MSDKRPFGLTCKRCYTERDNQAACSRCAVKTGLYLSAWTAWFAPPTILVFLKMLGWNLASVENAVLIAIAAILLSTAYASYRYFRSYLPSNQSETI